MANILKKYEEFIKENATEVEPIVKPTTAPTTTPTRRKSPIRRDKPSVDPRPKASVEDVTKKTLELAETNKEFKSFLNKKYSK